MSLVRISPSSLNGRVQIPPSKSAAHRAILCAALAKGKSEIYPIDTSKDMQATIQAIEALGAKIKLENKVLTIDSSNLFKNSSAIIDCIESGSTLRFLIPIAASGGISAEFIGSGRLPERPLGIYLDILPDAGVHCKSDGGLPLSISGQLKSGKFSLPGNISSQFITGLLLALPLLDGDSEIILTTPLESEGYVLMTIDMMREFGVTIKQIQNGWKISGNQSYLPRRYMVEGDWSQAAFFLSAGVLGGNIAIDGLNYLSVQGDLQGIGLFSDFGGDIRVEDGELHASGNSIEAINIDASQIPDLVPILAVTACFAQGTTRITGAARLRIKESDRLAAIADNLNLLGGNVEQLDDGLIINGVKKLKGGTVNGYNDHRIVMAMSIAGLNAEDDITITDAHSIEKSYPQFFEDYKNLGGIADVIYMG